MRGKKAKQIRKMAEKVLSDNQIPLGEGYNHYSQINNCFSWEEVFTKNGLPARDPDGFRLKKPVMKPGTILNKWKLRIVYQNLKRLWKRSGHGQDILFKQPAAFI